MGMQYFINKTLLLKSKAEIKYDICPECGRKPTDWFKNIFGTLECMCGKKFYKN